ncbi:DUF4097 family beta strand repeat-containing protein [Aliikangiella sp. IMCC44359]|uniref:DUF4097 family beta strand repeat-containing protein n=1 Tax=Aliikangiella sp. IMCC44359 TaxID=3459125 RepID=UPI00403B1186
MRKFIALLLLSISFNALAGEKVDKTIDAEADGTVEIHNVRGKVVITGWENNQVKVSGTLDDLAEEFIFERKGSKTKIKVKLPRNSSHHSRDGSKLKIMVPTRSKVSFSGVATDLEADLIRGGIDVNSVSGDIKINNTQERTYINSVSGDLVLRDLIGRLEVSTVSGDLDAIVNCEKVNISGVSAELKVKLQKIESANVSNVSGDTHVYGRLISDGEVRLSSVSGEAIYYVDGELDAKVNIETAPGGEIINQYSDDKPVSSFINSHRLKFTAGGGNGVLNMSTVSGDIGLKKGKQQIAK